MFNVFLHDKRQELADKKQRDEERKLKWNHTLKGKLYIYNDKFAVRNAKMAQNYRDRVGGFIVRMLEEPVTYHDEYASK